MAESIIAIVASVLSLLLPVAVRIIGLWLDKKGADREVVKKFYDFVSTLEASLKTPAKLRSSAARQRKRLDDMLAKIDKEENGVS